MADVVKITREEVQKYAGSGRGAGLRLYALLDDERHIYAVNAIHLPPDEQRSSGIVVMARIIDENIIVEVDNTDKPLVDALRQREVPRERIVLAYAGESLSQQLP